MRRFLVVLPYLLATVALIATVLSRQPKVEAQSGRTVTCDIASGMVLPFPGTHATSHSGWSRYTALDGKFVRVTTGDDAEGTGGTASHTLVGDQHRHTVSSGAGNNLAYYDSWSFIVKGFNPACVDHTHASSNGAYATISYANADNAPAAYEVIWKEADGSVTTVPTGFLAFSSVSAPANWRTYVSGDEEFLKGAAASGDGGSSVGSDSHSHTPSAHSHSAANSTAAGGTGCGRKFTGVTCASGDHSRYNHVHSVSMDSATSSTPDNSTDIPAWEKSLLVENNSGSNQAPFEGMYAYWTGSAASIPADWTRDDLTADYDFERTTLDAGEIEDTGGVRTHTAHAVSTPHAHSATAGLPSLCCEMPGVDNGYSPYVHAHTWTVADATETTQASAEYAHYPAYVKLIRIRCTGTPPTATPTATSTPTSTPTNTPTPTATPIAVPVTDTFDRFRRGGSRR